MEMETIQFQAWRSLQVKDQGRSPWLGLRQTSFSIINRSLRSSIQSQANGHRWERALTLALSRWCQEMAHWSSVLRDLMTRRVMRSSRKVRRLLARKRRTSWWAWKAMTPSKVVDLMTSCLPERAAIYWMVELTMIIFMAETRMEIPMVMCCRAVTMWCLISS